MRYTELNLEKLNLEERREIILRYSKKEVKRVIVKTRHEPWLQGGQILGPDKENPNERYLFKSEDVTRLMESNQVLYGKRRTINYLDTERILIKNAGVRFGDIRKCSGNEE